MTVKEKLTKDFNNLLEQIDDKEFNLAKLQFYRTLFSNSKEEDNLDICTGLFEVTCREYVKEFSPSYKKLLLGDFEKILIAFDAFQAD